MDIYLDIDGVILANDKQPALHADEFIRHLVSSYPVYWLTTHCQNPGDDPTTLLSQFFSEDTIALLKQIKPTQWDLLKTEAIDFSRPFRWIDDDLLPEEETVLRQQEVLDSWVEVDLASNPHQLRTIITQLSVTRNPGH